LLLLAIAIGCQKEHALVRRFTAALIELVASFRLEPQRPLPKLTPRRLDREGGKIMSTEWLISPHDIEIAAEIEREIARIERPGGRIGGRFGLDYATGLPLRDIESIVEAGDAAEQPGT
jgi:hypothetical protein